MSNILETLKGEPDRLKPLLEENARLRRLYEYATDSTLELRKKNDGLIILDPKLDPDPYGFHGMPVWQRLEAMGWKNP